MRSPASTRDATTSEDPVRMAMENPAFRVTLERQILSMLHKRMGHLPLARREQEASEIASDTLARMLSKRDKFNPDKANVAAWAHGIANKICYEQSRVSKKWQQMPSEGIEAVSVNEDTPDTEELKKWLEHLSSTDRRLIEMYHWQELPHREIAEKLGISEGAARIKLHRVMKELRKIAGKEGGQ